MAKKAALHRLRKAGEARGYTFVTIGEPRIAEPFGHQLVIEGTLHMAADAPENAVSLASIDGEKVEPPTRPAPARTAKRKPAKVAAPPVDEKPTVIMATEPPPAEADEPVVIMAPVY